jgi:signal peptidase I
VNDRPNRHARAARSRAWRDGWVWFVTAQLSRSYLVFLGSLATVAILPGLLGGHATVVQTGSMEPGISPGDVVLTSALPDDADVPLGRVVSYDSPAEAEPDGVAKIRLHRIVDANDDGTFVTAGDANAEVDSTPIVRDQIIGQARLLVPWVGLPGWWIGHGDLAAVAAWAGLTALALAVAALDLPHTRRARRAQPARALAAPAGTRSADSAPSGSDGEPASPVDAQPVDAQPVDAPSVDVPSVAASVDASAPASGDVGRRAVVSGVGALVLFGLLSVPRQPADAAFTASTSTGRNSWSVAVVAPLTPGRAAGYLLFATTSITNHNSSAATSIDGSIATSPGTAVSGFSWWNVDGSIDRNTESARNARTDAVTLASAVDSRAATGTLASTVTGTIRPGVYTTTGSATTSGTITLDARGDASAVFIFRASSITTNTATVVRLVNGARAANVYWRATNAVSIGRDSTALGTYIAGTSASLLNGSSVTGRVFALSGSISVDRATVRSL